jgi:hypothetical protein
MYLARDSRTAWEFFLAHQDRWADARNKVAEFKAAIWFYGAGDHIIEMNIPESLPNNIKIKAKKFKAFVLARRQSSLDNFLNTDIDYALKEAKDILLMVDKHLGAKTTRGSWE